MILRYLGIGRPRERFTAPLAPDETVYAIGDIHGRDDLLAVLLERIADDRDASGEAGRLVFLGDYVDRGEASRDVLDRLIDVAADDPGPAPIFLMGNHEEMLLDFLLDPSRGRRWLRYGGLETLASYGLGQAAMQAGAAGALDEVAAALAERLGEHRDFLRGLESLYSAGNVLFVHAGADPAVSARAQPLDVLLWGIESFGQTPRRDGLWVVHGHTIVSAPAMREGVISVDTGACYTGTLTAARIGPGGCRFLST